MSDFVARSIFCFLIIATLFVAVLIGRKIFKTGVEHFSGRILILSGILNVTLCIALLFFQTISNSSISLLDRLIAAFLAIIIPLKVQWNYWRGPGTIISQFNLQPIEDKKLQDSITSLSKSMEIIPPVILSSDFVRTPFVFGRSSKNPYIAVPKQWNSNDQSANYPVVLHELAHIRNHDIGFQAWAQAFTKDFKLVLTIFSTLIILGFIYQYKNTVSSLCIYLSCLLTLYGLLKYILRKCEYLADKTAALLIESMHVKQAIDLHSTENFNQTVHSTGQSKTGLSDRLYRWLIDKAMFSNHPKGWNFVLRVFTFFRLSHPPRVDRIKNILSNQNLMSEYHIAMGDFFWAGVALGFLGMAIGLCGYWCSEPVNYAPDDVDCLLLSYTLYGLAAVPAVGFWTVFMTLPFWASLGNPNMDITFFKALFKRHTIAFSGALLISFLILTAGPFQLHFQVLLVLCILWQLLIILMGFCISIVSVFLWSVTRYFQASDAKGVGKTLWTFIPLLIASLGPLVIGMVWISNEKVTQGAYLVLSTLTGITFFLYIIGKSRFSEQDHYQTISCILFTYQIEGGKFLRQYKLIDVVISPSILLILILLPYACIYMLFNSSLELLNTRWAIISLIIIGCMILVLIRLSEKGKARQVRRVKIYKSHTCLKLLSKSQSQENINKISTVAKSYKFTGKQSLNSHRNLTTDDIYMSYHLTTNKEPEFTCQIIGWLLSCQRTGGFGLWPKSSPRLISTYQSLAILKEADHLNNIDIPNHIRWIKSFQQPDGSFQGPWSKRDVWEDTFFATQSLSVLRAFLAPDNANQCCQWTRNILQKGINSDSANMVYHSIGTLNALDQLDEQIINITFDWFGCKVEKLLLSNIGLNYEDVYFMVMTYDILRQKSLLDTSNYQIELLADRIHTALDAELADIRI